MNYCIKILLIGLITASISACTNFFKPHKIAIQQGNIVTKEMFNKLAIGMDKRQVKYILGTPLIVDTFVPDQWHYIYSLRLGSGKTLTSTLKLGFVDGLLQDIDDSLQSNDKETPEAVGIAKENKKLDRLPPEKQPD